ncbi:MAG: RagB/SusD family nutrient uptake outer membrane protein [Prevotella sp.]|nr:RagB/SusD family nutrient uptake outer membrane protein [Prevotella sp.]
MKKLNIFLLSIGVLLAFSSCDTYLDKLPDDRAEVDSKDKVAKLLVDAYPQAEGILIQELSSDNVADNGKQYSTESYIDEMYRFKTPEYESTDSPYAIWDYGYRGVATANQALAAIDKLGDTDELKPYKGEALLCRALNMFILSNVFCMAYDSTKCDTYPGLPYPTTTDQPIKGMTERGTLRELYAHINADIEEALPLIDDNAYSIPKYHFNKNAAYAFAARFNLYYHHYDKAIAYATQCLGSDPTVYLRKWTNYRTLAGSQDIFNNYIQSSDAANFLLIPSVSIVGRWTEGNWLRYVHNDVITKYETYWAACPWAYGATSSNDLYQCAHMLYGNAQVTMFPKLFETLEYTDKVNGIGYPHTVDVYFTGDETILVRAEAYALRNGNDDLQKAVDDLNTWASTNLENKDDQMTRPTYTVANLTNYVESVHYASVTPVEDAERSFRKVLHPQGFTVAKGSQEDIIQVILHARRLTTCFQGMRFQDCKRYGIEYTHFVDKEDPIVFKAGDLRGAIQIPEAVINAGLAANPR